MLFVLQANHNKTSLIKSDLLPIVPSCNWKFKINIYAINKYINKDEREEGKTKRKETILDKESL